MKQIKWVIGLLMISLAFLLNSELYQNYLKTFTNQFYYFEVYEDEQREQVNEYINVIANNNSIGVFCVTMFADTKTSCVEKIYMTEGAMLPLSECNIAPGTKKSMFSGTTNIVYEELENFGDVADKTQRYYFTCSKDNVELVKDQVGEKYDVSRFILKEDSDSFDFLIWAVWGIVYGVLLLLTIFDIKLQSKENFIKISMGIACGRIVIKNICMDIGYFFTIFVVGKGLLSRFVNIEYKELVVQLLFGLFIILNSLLYFTMFRYNYKQVLYGAVIDYKVIGDCYVLKTISMIIAIVTLAISINMISENIYYLQMFDEIEEYKDYYFLTVKANATANNEEEYTVDLQADTECRIFYDYYGQNKVAMAVSVIVQEDNAPIISINQNTVGVPDFICNMVSGDFIGYYIFIPYEQANKQGIGYDVFMRTMLSFEGFSEQIDYKVIVYDEDIEMLYFDSEEGSKFSMGFGKAENPIIVYFNNLEGLVEYTAEDVYIVHENIMYCFTDDDIRQLESEYDIQEFNVVNVVEQCEQYKFQFMQKLMFVSSISLFMIVLEMVIMVTIIRLEYCVNAKELVVKKILGYSIWKKNRELILLNLFGAFTATGAMVVVHFMYKILCIENIVFAGIVTLLLEQIFTIYYIRKIEKANVSKILKGGCL